MLVKEIEIDVDVMFVISRVGDGGVLDGYSESTFEGNPFPTLLVAKTENEYVVPLDKPVISFEFEVEDVVLQELEDSWHARIE